MLIFAHYVNGMYMHIKELDRSLKSPSAKERSNLEWKVTLPFMWIDAAASNDVLLKENLLRDAVARNDARAKSLNTD